MADGFTVTETLDHAPADVWACLTDFANASQWMTGIGDFIQITPGPLGIGTQLRFKARGKERETRVTAFDPGKLIALTSTQGGVTATYTYAVTPSGDGTDMVLKATCNAAGFWKLLHPVIVLAMKNSDSSQLANLKRAMGRLAGDSRHPPVM